LIEAEELKNLKQNYLNRIEEIKQEHVIALEPVIGGKPFLCLSHHDIIYFDLIQKLNLRGNTPVYMLLIRLSSKAGWGLGAASKVNRRRRLQGEN